MSDWKLISTANPSGAVSVEFTDLTGYKIFKFAFINVNPASSDPDFNFQVNASGQTGFNAVITSTVFRAYHDESDSTATLAYTAGQDQAQGTSYQCIARNVGSGSDECTAGELFLFNPASTTYVKHFYCRSSGNGAYEMDTFAAGYINTTSAITQISFKTGAVNFDGTIKQYGLVAS
jgi:hypothetical protein